MTKISLLCSTQTQSETQILNKAAQMSMKESHNPQILKSISKP